MTRALMALLAALFVTSGPRAEPIKISIPNVHAGFGHVFAAEQKGYFKEEGLEVEVKVLGGGVATPALIGGSLHYSSSPSSAISAILKGAPLRIVLTTGTRPIYELWSFDPNIRSLEGLKGQQIATMTRGGTDEIALRMLLLARNLPKDYIAFSPLGREGRMAALIAGTQKISLVGRVEKAELEKAGLITRGRMLVDLGESVELATGGLVTTERAVTIDRARTKKVLRALWKGAIYLKTETAGMVQVMEKRLPHATRETQLRDIEGAREDLSVDGTIPLAATTRELAVRGELIGLAPDKLPPPDKVYDFSLMREIVAELEATNWKPTP